MKKKIIIATKKILLSCLLLGIIIFSIILLTQPSKFNLKVYGGEGISEQEHTVYTSLGSNLITYLWGWKSEPSTRMEDLGDYGMLCERYKCEKSLSIHN